jgi:tetratricopeptide (TPR) repeat protein
MISGLHGRDMFGHSQSTKSMILQTFVVIIVSLVAGVASAQNNSTSTGSSAATEARVHFERGVELYGEGSFDAALAEFERANQIAPNYKLLYNLAQVQAERHEYVAAVNLMTQYLQAGGSEIAAERRQTVAEDMEKLRQRISELTIDVSVGGAEVFVNDVSVGRSPLSAAVLVNVGTCHVRAEKPGYVTKLETIAVTGADRPRLELTLAAAPVVAQHGARQQTIKSADMTPFWISLGATVVLGGTTGVFGALTLSANHDLDHALNQFPAPRDSIDSTRQKVKTMAALTDAFGAATIVAAGTALYFLIAPPDHTEVVPVSGLHARLTPAPNGMALSGTF